MVTIYLWGFRVCLTMLVMFALLLTGCAEVKQVGGQFRQVGGQFRQFGRDLRENVSSMVVGETFPGTDSADSCNNEVLALQADYEYFQQPLVTRAANNRLNNAMQTFIQGGNPNMIMDAAVKGFAADLVSASLQQATKDYLGSVGSQNEGNYGGISQRINSDASTDSNRLASVQSKIANLESCRTQQIQTVTRNYKRKTISAKEARRQAEQIQEWVRRDNQVIEKIVGQSGARVDVYVEADQYVAEQQNTPSNRSVARKQGKKRSASRKPKPSPSVAKAQESHKNAKKEQEKIAKLDKTIEQIKTEDFA